MPSVSRDDLERAASDFFRSMAAELDQPRHFDPAHFDEEVAFNIESSRARTRELDEQLKTNLFDQAVKVRAEEIVRSTGAELAELSDREQRFSCQLAARAEREQMQLLIHLLQLPHVQYTAEDGLFDTSRRIAPTSLTAAAKIEPQGVSSIVLREAVTIYLGRKVARGLSQSQINEVGRALTWLRERLGDLRPLSDVNKAEMRKFRDDISRLDITLRGSAGAFEMRLTNEREKQIKSVTALRYWRAVQSFFEWCAAEQYAPDDPSAGLKLEMRKGETKRSPPPFTAEELKRLFRTPLYSGYHSRSRLSEPGACQRREGHWWSGVLLMFTGLRAGELSQFLPEDFVFSSEIPHLKVRTEDALGERVKTTKNAASVRDVPLAWPLLELGLAEFVAARAKVNPKARVFREFRPGTQGRKSDGLTKFWSRYLKKFDLWKEGRSTHVWRHTVIACLRANDVPIEDIAAFVGHSRGTVTEGYGGSYPLSRKLKTVTNLDYGFDVVAALGGPYSNKLHGS
jgi:integrase